MRWSEPGFESVREKEGETKVEKLGLIGFEKNEGIYTNPRYIYIYILVTVWCSGEENGA